MTQPTKIQWAERTWNPLTGCSKVSAGCEGCYAIPTAWKLSHNPNPKIAAAYAGTVKKIGAALQWTGKINLLEDRLLEPLRLRKPSRIFVNSMADLFHPAVPDEFIDRIYAVMALCPQHQFMTLTKRPGRRREYFRDGPVHGDGGFEYRLEVVSDQITSLHLKGKAPLPKEPWTPLARRWPLSNVSEGTSVEDQATADERIPLLLEMPAAVRWVSYEPAIAGVDFGQFLPICFACMGRLEWRGPDWICTECGHTDQHVGGNFLDGIVMGGESGPGARPMEGIYQTLAQCRAAGVPAFVKQLGAVWAKRYGLKNKKGGDMAEWPEDLRVRELPGAPQATAKTAQ